MTTKLVAQPDLAFLAQQIVRVALMQTNCHAIATIQSVDYSSRTVKANLVYTRIVDGSTKQYPVLVDCPFIVLQGGGGSLTFPIAANDTCFVFFNDVNMSRFIASGNLGAQPLDTRSHAFADAVVLIGLDSIPAANAKDYFADGVELAYADGDGNSSLQLTDTIKLQNEVTDLKAVLQGLVDAIDTYVATGVVASGTGAGGTLSFLAGKVAFDAYKTTIAGLLT